MLVLRRLRDQQHRCQRAGGNASHIAAVDRPGAWIDVVGDVFDDVVGTCLAIGLSLLLVLVVLLPTAAAKQALTTTATTPAAATPTALLAAGLGDVQVRYIGVI